MYKFLIFLCFSFVLQACQKYEGRQVLLSEDVVAVGDSLTFGYGGNNVNYPEELSLLIQRKVINEGISGDTSQGVLNRIDEILETSPGLILLSIGGNDMLRRVPDETIKTNLNKIIEKIKAKDIPVILIAQPRPKSTGMIMGLDDATFYKDVAKNTNTLIVEDAFSDLLSKDDYKSDLIHLNSKGYKEVAQTIATEIKAMKILE